MKRIIKPKGQVAYERDVKARPLYHTGQHRPSWDQLSAVAKWSWERNPTDRSTAKPLQAKTFPHSTALVPCNH